MKKPTAYGPFHLTLLVIFAVVLGLWAGGCEHKDQCRQDATHTSCPLNGPHQQKGEER